MTGRLASVPGGKAAEAGLGRTAVNVAHLVRIKPEPCQVCPKLAVVTLYDKNGVKQGDYCQYHGDMNRIELQAQEYYEKE